MSSNKYECEEKLMCHFNLTKGDMKMLWDMFMEYGVTRGEASHRSKGNHYFLQGICEHMVVEWDCWKSKLTKEVKEVIQKKYPQLMTTNTSYRWGN